MCLAFSPLGKLKFALRFHTYVGDFWWHKVRSVPQQHPAFITLTPLRLRDARQIEEVKVFLQSLNHGNACNFSFTSDVRGSLHLPHPGLARTCMWKPASLNSPSLKAKSTKVEWLIWVLEIVSLEENESWLVLGRSSFVAFQSQGKWHQSQQIPKSFIKAGFHDNICWVYLLGRFRIITVVTSERK